MSDLIVASLMILKKQCHPPKKKCSSGQMNWWWEQTCSAGWSEKPARSRSHADEWHRGRGIRLRSITRTYFWGRLLLLKLSGFDKLRQPLTLPSNSLGALAQSCAGVILIQSANVQRCVFLSRCICYITLLQNPSLICTWVSLLALALIAARDESENAAQMIAGRRCVCVCLDQMGQNSASSNTGGVFVKWHLLPVTIQSAALRVCVRVCGVCRGLSLSSGRITFSPSFLRRFPWWQRER